MKDRLTSLRNRRYPIYYFLNDEYDEYSNNDGIRILHGKAPLNGAIDLSLFEDDELDWNESAKKEAQRKQDEYDRWMSYYENNPFHCDVKEIPTYSQEYALYQAKSLIESTNEYCKFFCGAPESALITRFQIECMKEDTQH